jgi:hypothetical protein
VVICDACNAVVREVDVQRYVPEFNVHGNDPYVAA